MVAARIRYWMGRVDVPTPLPARWRYGAVSEGRSVTPRTLAATPRMSTIDDFGSEGRGSSPSGRATAGRETHRTFASTAEHRRRLGAAIPRFAR